MSEFTINVVQDPSTIIDINNSNQTVSLNILEDQYNSIQVNDNSNDVLLNPSVFYNGINIVYLSGVSGELLHNTFGDLQGGSTGQYYHLSSGQYFNLITGAVVRPNETGSFLTIGSADLRYVGLAGDQTISGAKAFVLRPSVNGTGVMLSGEAVSVNTGELTGAFYPLNSNPSNYITGSVVRPSETGVFYPTSNPSGYITGVDLSAYVTGNVVRPSETGNFITASQTGAFYAASNPSGFITGVNLSNYSTIAFSTGISGSLQNQITNLNNQTGNYYPTSNPSGFITGVDLSFSGNYYTKSESESRYVNTTGAETILGDKTFHDKVYINNLYVTGLETIVNTTNTNIASNFIMLNLTGGAVDGGLFFVTGAGLTGINDSGAILGFDHSDKFKFGIGTRASDLSVLDTIASVEEMTGISGSLQTQISSLSNATGSYVLNSQTGAFYSVSNPSGFITGVDLSTYATITNLAATGSTLQTNINNLSGVYATISNLNSTGSSLDSKISLLSGSSVLLYGDQTISGVKTFTTGVNISGNLTVDTNTLFVDSVNNRVGIGTTTPQSTFMLDVNGQVVIRGDNYLNGSLREFGANAYKLSKAGDSWINGGNVGIGTTTPAAPLHINTSLSGVAVRIGQDGTVGRLEFGNVNVALTRISNQLALQGFDGFTFGTSSGERMRIDSSGNVGIGTSSLIGKLDVAGSLTTTTPSNVLVLSRPYNPGVAFHTAASFRLSNPNTNVNNTRLDIALQQGNSVSPVTPDTTVMTLLGDGRVGIGTTSPLTPLHTYTAGNNSLTIEAGAGDSQVMLRSAGSLKFLFGYEDSDDGFRIYNYGTSATSLFAKSTNGYIGIGTVAPNERLTVSGNANISGNISANNLVYNTGNQTVSGIKNFQSVPLVSGEEVYYKKNVVYFTGNNFTPDANLARTFEYVLTGLAGASATLNAPINMNNGENIVIKIKQSPSGSNNIIFNSNYKFPGGVIPSLTLTPSKADIYTALKIDSNFYSTYIKDFIN